MEEQLNLAKQAFLNRYNPQRKVELALSKSISAAVQHNSTYSAECIGEDLRRPIRNFWGQELIQLAKKYVEPQNVLIYETDILALQEIMNANYRHQFSEDGFKISHSQKSISVFLKHLWCLGFISPPPLCPVDRIMLTHVGYANAQPAWTRVNSMNDYRQHVALLLNHKPYIKSGRCIAEWELLSFANP